MNSYTISFLGGLVMVALLGVQVSMYMAAALCVVGVLGLMYLAWRDYLGAVLFLVLWAAFLTVIWTH